MAALHDPTKKVEVCDALLADIDVVEDEFGEKHELIEIGDLTFNKRMLLSTQKRLIADPKQVKLRESDILLPTYPKTGNIRCLF